MGSEFARRMLDDIRSRNARVLPICPFVRAFDEVLAGLTDGERRELLALLRRTLDSAPAQPLWSSEEGD